MVIESIKEDLSDKKYLFNEINNYVDESCIISTNTSSLSINQLGYSIKNNSRFIGLHFFNPVPKMKLVEIVSGNNTSKKTLNDSKEFIKQINYEPILCKDSPGFIVNKLLIPQIANAINLYSENIASKEDIDKAIKLRLGHPMRPLKLCDYIGIDVVLSILKNLEKSNLNNYTSSIDLLEKMINDNKLGLKNKKGFYDWNYYIFFIFIRSKNSIISVCT